jgi:predicted unusual protein kinase regulating ubiquinone biosynthesis (AarF/ABC1/UbiB family)
MSDDKLRRGFGQRLWSTAKVASQAARLATRQVVTGNGDPEGAVGASLLAELDRMKGVAMKVGQILSYMDGALPEATHEALRGLQTGAEPVSFKTISEVIRDAFGRDVDELFEAFDRRPVAAASIGQVHRARFNGEEIAVKVQYPGIADTMVADIGRLRSLSRMASLATAVDGPAIVDELATRMRQECDYLLEAQNQHMFARAFADDTQVDIPDVVLERTRKTVLTTAWRPGSDFYTFAQNASPHIRDAAGLVLTRFALHSFFGLRMLNADPHPGNYLFTDTGRVTFLDFGCVTTFTKEFVEAERRLTKVVVTDQRARFEDAVMATGLVADAQRFDFDVHWKVLCHQYAPYRVPKFRLTTEFIRDGMALNGPQNPNLRRLNIPPPWIWVQRLIWGLHSVLARLGCEADFASVLRKELEAEPSY